MKFKGQPSQDTGTKNKIPPYTPKDSVNCIAKKKEEEEELEKYAQLASLRQEYQNKSVQVPVQHGLSI